MPTKYGMCGTIGGRYDISSSVRIFGADGSVHVQHGGCEIGQGIHTKVAQAVALGLRCPLELVRVGETSTSVSPNSSSTGGSGTSESAVRSVLIACRKLRTALAPYDVADDWVATVAKAFAAGAELAAHGWSTPPSEEPFDYATYGVAAVEVQIDALTGELQIERADLMMDQGTPLNPAVDLGQAEGGFVMALGLFFTEEVQWSAAGAQLNLGTWEYKVPGAHDIPLEFNIEFARGLPNPSKYATLRSKASGEPPMALGGAAFLAARAAIRAYRASALGDVDADMPIDAPLTVERVQQACGVSAADFVLE